MNTKRVVSAATREIASVKKLRERLTPTEFDEFMRTELRPYFRNESALNAIIRLETHIWEFGVMLDMKDHSWFTDGLVFFVQQFNRAKESDQANVQQSLTSSFSQLNLALARYSDAFHLEHLDIKMPPHLLSRSAFRQLGDVLEGCYLPFIRQVYSLLSIASHSGLYHDPSSARFGNLVSDLCAFPKTRMLYQDLLRGVPIHHWRNIAQHSSYSYDEDIQQIKCVYGLPPRERTITLSCMELLELLRQIDRTFAIHKIAVGFFTADNIEMFRELHPSPTITRDTVAGTLLFFFETQGLQVSEFDTSNDPWAISLIDMRTRPEEEVKRLLTHAAQFTALRPDVGLRFYVKSARGHGHIQGEIRKRKPTKTYQTNP